MSLAIQAEAAAKYPNITAHGCDHKAWAKRFVYRFQRGDKTLLDVQIKFAHQALEIELPKPAAV